MNRSRRSRLLPGLMATILVFAGTIATPPAGAAESGIIRLARVLSDDPLFQCVAVSEYEIAGLGLYGDLSNMHHLGAPASLIRNHGEDDGGGYIATTYRYDGLDVTIVRGKIDSIKALAARWPTPSGLKAGMTRREAVALLGRKPDPEQMHDGVYSFGGCPEIRDGKQFWPDSWYFEFAFGDNGRVSFVRLIVDRP